MVDVFVRIEDGACALSYRAAWLGAKGSDDAARAVGRRQWWPVRDSDQGEKWGWVGKWPF